LPVGRHFAVTNEEHALGWQARAGEQGVLHGVAALLPELLRISGFGDGSCTAFLLEPRQACLLGLCLRVLA